MPRPPRLAAAVLWAALAAGAGAVRAAPPAGHGAAAARGDGITVTSDGRLARGCRPWVPDGLDFFGLMVPRGRPMRPDVAHAKAFLATQAIGAVRFFGGDTMRLEVGLPFLDPRSPAWTPGFVDEVREAVQAGRDAGFAVIVVLQWEPRTGVPGVENLPGDAALRAWRTLGPVFAHDPGVVYELFNEPVGPAHPSADDWARWRAGHQALVDALRALGATNTLLADGLHSARTLDGAPPLADPLHRIAYAVHPYLDRSMRTPADLEDRFGRFAATHPVVATEWTSTWRSCDGASNADSVGLVRTLDRLGIGLVAYGADESPGRLLRGEPGAWRPTRFEGLGCRDREAGPGRLVRALFARRAAAEAAAPRLPPGLCEGRAAGAGR